MKIDTWELMQETFGNIIGEVVENISKRAKELLIKHINTDTYGINKTATNEQGINKIYLNGTGTPSYEFRDKAWDIKFQKQLTEHIFYLMYNSDNLTPPSTKNNYLHGNYDEGIDRRIELPELLNVNGIAPDGDFNDFPNQKRRSPYWDNFIEELNQKIGGWLFTEFRKRGLEIPALKLFKGEFIG